MMTEAERIELLIALLEDGNGAAFARKIGCDKSRVTDIRRGIRGIDRYKKRILEAYPTLVSEKFLDTGDIGEFPLVALISYLVRENARLSGKKDSSMLVTESITKSITPQ